MPETSSTLSVRGGQWPEGNMDVFAYLDAGSGSMLLQMLVGGAAAVGVTAKLYWRRIKRRLHIGREEPEQQPEP